MRFIAKRGFFYKVNSCLTLAINWHCHKAIRGPTERSIVTVRTRIEILVEQSMDLVDYNYFIAFPLNAPEFVSVVDNWQQEILCHPNCNKWGIDQDVLVPPPQMHLTILMLKLYGADAVERASQLLTSLQSRIYDLVGTTSVVVKMKGLEIMNDDPTSAHVLYAKLVRDSTAKAQQVAGMHTLCFNPPIN